MAAELPDPDADPRFQDLLDTLTETWAQLDAGSDGLEIAAPLLRAAYGRGYVVALEER